MDLNTLLETWLARALAVLAEWRLLTSAREKSAIVSEGRCEDEDGATQVVAFVSKAAQPLYSDRNIQKLHFMSNSGNPENRGRLHGAVIEFASENESGSTPKGHRIVWSEGIC